MATGIREQSADEFCAGSITSVLPHCRNKSYFEENGSRLTCKMIQSTGKHLLEGGKSCLVTPLTSLHLQPLHISLKYGQDSANMNNKEALHQKKTCFLKTITSITCIES